MPQGKIIKIKNCRLLRNHQIVDNDYLWIQDGRIVDPQEQFFTHRHPPDETIDAGGMLVCPGFIDVQINGAFGVDFSDITQFDQDKAKQDLDRVAKGLLQYGCTAFAPTIVSSSPEVYRKVLPLLKPRQGTATAGATILGAHVEGPFISQDKNGAHNLEVLQVPREGMADFARVYGTENIGPEDAARGSERTESIRLITVAPDLEGSQRGIRELAKRGVVVSIGHSPASVQEAEEAVENGATFITHLFNAMQQFHHRDPGIIGLLGSNLQRPYYGLICDGVHCHPNSVKIAYYSHPGGAVLVTDAMSAMGLPPGKYTLGDMKVEKEEDRVYVEGTRTLAGSVITLDACVRNFKEFTGCSTIEALEAVTLHPAVLLGIQDRKGQLVTGADADLVFLDDDLRVKRVFVAGEEVQLE
ncbi:uncharacterized protein VTP21DRAFT_7419 [Calcarisporiella thermophila]|uniref:uncharacterized protein n=1 Tax=Calcarisporiella thermophila TaxID=911321 RepID=UPI00374399B8